MGSFTKVNIGAQLRRSAPRQGVLLLFAVGFVALFHDRLLALDISAIWAGFRTISALQWAGALLATGASFWAVGRYDAVLHRALATGIHETAARRAGVAGIAISQTLGLGLLSGALVRWRLLPELSLWQATRLSAMVALSFLAGWAVVTGAVLTVFPANLPYAHALSSLPLIALGLLIAASLWQPKISRMGRKTPWPGLLTIFSIIALAALDTLAAATALYLLLPDIAALPFATLYPTFLLALGCALVSGTPGGVGPFEVSLLALLPEIPAEPLLGAVLAFRAVYYALPALFAAAILARGAAQKPATNTHARLITPAARPALCEAHQDLLQTAPFAEANLLRQGEKMLLSQAGNRTHLIVAKTAQTLVALRDPLGPHDPVAALNALRHGARGTARLPCFYKCSARLAAQARKSGWSLLPIANEAWLDPRNFTPDTPRQRQLRRKLRKAKAAGVSIQHATAPLPMQDMARLSKEWAARTGGERGFSMGVFEEDFLLTQRCYLAYAKGRLQSFISLNTCNSEWSLDLMRQSAGAPDGTMQALVTAAIGDAAKSGLPRFSLASAPHEHRFRFRPVNALLTAFSRTTGGNGLRQFKTAFAPNWQTLYIAAPGPIALCLAGFDISRAIHHCDPPHRSSSL